jgi:Na+/H+ antiporter NhaC
VPVLYPAGVVLGAHPALLLGAIYSGARFGDNLAPISDTTVASALTQEAEVGEVVRTRVKYAVVAAAASVPLYLVAGAALGTGTFERAGEMSVDVDTYANPAAFLMLLAPTLTVILCLRGRSLIQGIWYGILAGTAIGLATGSLTIGSLYRTTPPRTVEGAITDGVTGMRDVVFLAILVMALLGALRRAGFLEFVRARIQRFATTPRRAELAIFVLVAVMCPLTAANTPALLLTGPVVRDIGEQFGIYRTRRANLMALSGNGVTLSLPHINTILALAGVMITTHEATGAPLVPITTVGLLAFHPMMLTVVGLVAIATGWGARRG